MAATLKIENNKNDIKSSRKNIGEIWNVKLKKRDDIFWRYYRNKKLNELFWEELEKENPILPSRFHSKQRECELFKTELKLFQVRFIWQQKFIMDIYIDMNNCIRNQHVKDIAVNLIQQWKKECQTAEEKAKARFT